jgi:integrase/recombinase XerC
MSKHLQIIPTGQSSSTDVGQAGLTRVTVSQLINQFTAWLPKLGNYPRLARQFVLYCLENRLPIDGGSLRIYAGGKAGNQISPVKKFLFFYQVQGYPTVLADPPASKRIPAAANELILGYLSEADRSASFSTQTIGQYVNDLRQRGLSAFTVNFYLSTIKQLTEWVIKHRVRLNLTNEQADNLRDVQTIRGLTIERGFYKDSLTETERDQLLDSIDDLTDRAIVALLVLEGLRTVEVTRLTVGDVELDRNQLQVLGKGKSTKKAIKLFDSCAHALRAYLQRAVAPAHRLGSDAMAASRPGQSTPLFPNLKTAQIRYRVDKYLTGLDLKRPKMSAHSLRHSAGQIMIDKGVEPTWVQRHLRHELFETTQFYIKKQTERDYFLKMPTDVR